MIKSAICAIARNEEDYLSEWITYHLNLGFEHIFLYDNNDPDNNNILRLYIEQPWREQVTLVNYRGKTAAQLESYNECFTTIRKDFDWIAFIDVDEFITFGTECPHTNINKYLEEIKDFDVIFINWMYYGDNEKVHFEKEDVIKRFPLPIPDCEINRHVKSIIKTSANINFVRNPHCPDGEVLICDDCQKPLPNSEPFKEPSFKRLYIRHYGTKTIEEFIRNKMLRGAADQNSNPYKIDLFYKINRHTKEKRKIEKQFFQIHNQKNTQPLVSVIIPNYNHKKFLNQRINSVLSQTFTDFELILLDDCSTDNSQELLLSYKNNPHVSHIVINTKNGNSPFLQWEKGIRLAKGKYIWIAESDDSAEPTFLSSTVKQLELNPEARICLTGSYIIDEENNPACNIYGFDQWTENGETCIFQSNNYLETHMLHTNSIYNASMVLFRKEGCLSNIMTDYRNMHYCGDWLFWIEQIRKGTVIEIHQKLNYFRKHLNNTTSQGTTQGNSFAEMAFIRNLLYRKLVHNKKAILKDKYMFYQAAKHVQASSHRKKELFKILSREANITFWHYLMWKVYKTFLKRLPN